MKLWEVMNMFFTLIMVVSDAVFWYTIYTSVKLLKKMQRTQRSQRKRRRKKCWESVLCGTLNRLCRVKSLHLGSELRNQIE